MKNIAQPAKNSEASLGNVFIMTHSFFSDVIRIGCTTEDPETYATMLSKKTPGKYSLVFALQCVNPCHITKQLKTYLTAQEYANEFYQVEPEVATNLLRRESLRIPMVSG